MAKRKPRTCRPVQKLSLLEAIQRLKTSMEPVMVQFSAPWCGACQQTIPEVQAASCDLEGEMDVVRVDVDEQPLLAAEFGVENLPTVAIIRHGKVETTSVGAESAKHFKKLARDWLKANGHKG